VGLDKTEITLTGFSALGTSYGTACAGVQTKNATAMNFMVVVDKGDATSISLMVEWSIDGSTWGQQRSGAVTAGTETLSAHEMTETLTGDTNIPISMPTNGYRFVRISRKVDDATGAAVTITAQRG